MAVAQPRKTSVARLLILVEGETEELFANEVLRPHLQSHGYSLVGARLMGNARQRNQRGGIRAWPTVRYDVVNHLKEDRGRLVTTMVDYYRLPKTGRGAWPGRETAGRLPVGQRAQAVEHALSIDVSSHLADQRDEARFVPFVVMHEFEGLLFSDCSRFAASIGMTRLTRQFQDIRDAFSNPEEINDSPETAPSKRVLELVPGYQKPLLGTLAILDIGLGAVRGQCPHFDQWLTRLESAAHR